MKLVEGYVRVTSPTEHSQAQAWVRTFGCFLGREIRTLPGFPRDLHLDLVRCGRCNDGFVYYQVLRPVSERVFVSGFCCTPVGEVSSGSCLRTGVRRCS